MVKKIVIYGITLTVLVSVAIFAPHSTAGDVYIESGPSGTILIKHTMETGHYFKANVNFGRHDEDTPAPLAGGEGVEENWLGDGGSGIEYGYNFTMGNLTLSPHVSHDAKKQMVTYCRIVDFDGICGTDDDEWLANGDRFGAFNIGLDAKYYLPHNVYASFGTHAALIKVKAARSYKATASIGWADPTSNVSIEAGYNMGHAISDFEDTSSVGVLTQEIHSLNGAYISVGWTF